MNRLVRLRAIRNFVAFFRSGIFRLFFFSEDRWIRMRAWRLTATLSFLVFINVITMLCLTLQINYVNNAFLNGSGFESNVECLKTLALLFCFYFIERKRQPTIETLSWEWREARSSQYGKKLHLLVGLVDHVSQRMADAVNKFTTLAPECFVPLLHMIIVAGVFLWQLWGLSSHFAWTFPGMLVWFTLLYCIAQNLYAWRKGRPLVSLQKNSQGNESILRRPLENFERKRKFVSSHSARRVGRWLEKHVMHDMREVTLEIIKVKAHLNGIRSFNIQVFAASAVILMILANFGFLPSGQEGFGLIMQIAATLGATHGALSTVSELIAKLAELRGTHERLLELDEAILSQEEIQQSYATAAE